MKVIQSSLVAGLSIAACLLAGPALAQTPAYSDVPDRFRIEAGGFRIGADTELSFNTSGGLRPPVNFEGLNLPDSATRFYVEGFWRPWRRHEFSLSFYQHDREGDPVTVQRSFTWGDRVVDVGSTVQAHTASHYLSGAYRFAAYKNDRFEIGPALGIGYLSIEAGISGDVSVIGENQQASRPFDQSKSLGQMTGDLGGYVYFWATPRLLLRGDMRYIFVSPDNSEASITDGRAAVLYHPWRSVGFGLQYTYTKFRYDREIISTDLGGTLRYSGGQVVVSAAF